MKVLPSITTSMNKPMELTKAEWEEVALHPAVQGAWGLTDETPEEFASQVYAVKFNFHSGAPGYVGDLYILQGDMLTGDAPWVFTREDGKLVLQSEIGR
jgi:hypothetical protein